MSTHILVLALAHAMAVLAPTSLANAPAFPGWAETPEEREERYEGIAEAAVDVAFDPAETPVFSDAHGRARTAALLLGIAYKESGFARDVDLGPCYRGRDDKGPRCDGGRAACMLQIRTDVHHEWTSAELFASRTACFRAGLTLVRRSFAACPSYGPDGRLNVYASGLCLAGQQSGAERLATGRRLFELAHPAPDASFADVVAMR